MSAFCDTDVKLFQDVPTPKPMMIRCFRSAHSTRWPRRWTLHQSMSSPLLLLPRHRCPTWL
jgi:hypothetical protein